MCSYGILPERERYYTHSENDISNDKKMHNWIPAKALSIMLELLAKPTISNGNPKSLLKIWMCSQTVNDFESTGL